MKIVCNKNEFAELVRSCVRASSVYNGCSSCVFATLCTQGGDPTDNEIMCVIEDICEIVVNDG